MQIIISRQCKSLTGSIGKGFGYHIQRRKNGFFAKRNSKGTVPPDGHWRFIITCAQLAQNGLYITDIRVSRKEVVAAIREAALGCPLFGASSPNLLNAADILSIRSNGIRQSTQEAGL